MFNFKVEKNIPLKFINDGSEIYGFSEKILKAGNTPPVVLSIGIGHKTGFDEAMIGYYDAHVYGFDPTPTVVKYVQNAQSTGQLSKSNFHFQPYAIGGFDGEATFHFPADEKEFNGSLSSEAASAGDNVSTEVQIRTIETVMKENDISSVDLIQMDIEGGEFDVIEALHKNPIPCNQIAIEVHHGLVTDGIKKTRKALRQLSDMGYLLVDTRRKHTAFCELLFVHESEL
jgi:FkbM family methyltransferase